MNKKGCKTGIRILGPRDPYQSLKVGPGTLLKFKSGTPRLPLNFKGSPGPPSKFKRRTPGLQHSLMNSCFFQNILSFFPI